jgi:hypothetical protein
VHNDPGLPELYCINETILQSKLPEARRAPERRRGKKKENLSRALLITQGKSYSMLTSSSVNHDRKLII